MIDLEMDAAKRALEYAKNGIQNAGKEYKNLCKSFPTMIMSNGLAQAVSFYEAKAKDKQKKHKNEEHDEYKKVIENVENELNEFRKKNNLPIEQKGKLSETLLGMNLNDYLQFERFLLNTLKWLRRYVDVYNGN